MKNMTFSEFYEKHVVIKHPTQGFVRPKLSNEDRRIFDAAEKLGVPAFTLLRGRGPHKVIVHPAVTDYLAEHQLLEGDLAYKGVKVIKEKGSDGVGFGIVDNGSLAVPCQHTTAESAIEEWVHFERLNAERQYLPRRRTYAEIADIEEKLKAFNV